jgi:hypothetical protein
VSGCKRRSAALLLALALAFAARPAAAAGQANSIEQIVPKTLAPQSGGTVTFQIAVSPTDNTVWAAGSYTLTLIATAPNGTVVATSDPFIADEPAPPQQTTMVFVDLHVPASFSGPLLVRAHLQHGKTSDDSQPAGIVAGAAAAGASIVAPASPPPGQVPAPGNAETPNPEAPPPAAAPPPPPAAPNAQIYTGSLALNGGFSAQQTQSSVLNLSGKYGANDSVTAAVGLANTLGNPKPVVTIQTPALLTTIGTFAPTFDRDAFAGPTGTGAGFKHTWGQNVLQGAIISGNHDTTNPFQMVGLGYGFPLLGSAVSVTGGYENTYGPMQTGPFFLRNGAFFGFGDDITSPHSSITYGIHYGLTMFHDDVTDSNQSGQVFDLTLGFVVRKAQFAFTYVRASPTFANASAPGITPDRETETASVTLPLGALQVVFGVNAYRDDLPGSTLLQTTHFVTENAGVTYPLKNGDVLSFQATNGVQHQTGDPVSPFSGNNGTTFAYTTKRGPYAVQYTLTGSETRDNIGNLLHVITNGVTVARSPFAGITLSAGYNLNQNDASAEAQTTISNSATASLSYTLGPLTFSTQINHAIAHPFVGESSPPTTTYNYGLSVRPGKLPYTLTATVTENIGMINTSVGALSLNRSF